MKDILINSVRVANLLIFHEVIAEFGFGSQICCLFQDHWNLVKLMKPRTREFREASVREYR
jgi:hypothetical protein